MMPTGNTNHPSGSAAPSGNALVHAEGVSKWYGQVSGLNNVTVSIPPGITGTSAFAWLAPTAALQQLGDVIFRLQPRYQLSPALAALAVIVLIAGSIVILMRRVRGVEIVT